MSLEQVESMVKANAHATRELSLDRPLSSLAVLAVWTLQTLATHTQEVDLWMRLILEVAGLVSMCTTVTEDAASTPMFKALLYSLYRLSETLRQCEPTGYVTQQLKHKYEKHVRRQLKHDFEEQMRQLKDELATHAMKLDLYELSRSDARRMVRPAPLPPLS
eukprot:6930845-Prymnesium_polylepis.2